MRKKQIVVIGSGDDTSNIDSAYEIGKYIAIHGWVLISGGKGGIMESVSRGAYDNGGLVIGILPDSSLDSSNKYCNIVIPTGIGYARNLTNVLSGDVIIGIGGKAGTLSELAYAWQFKRPVILCSFSGGWSSKLAGKPVDDRGENHFHTAVNVKEVFELLDNILE